MDEGASTCVTRSECNLPRQKGIHMVEVRPLAGLGDDRGGVNNDVCPVDERAHVILVGDVTLEVVDPREVRLLVQVESAYAPTPVAMVCVT
jgi:hypothetical protein